MRTIKKCGLVFGAIALSVPMPGIHAQHHVIETLVEAKWGPAPPMLSPGAQMEVLGGNPMGDKLDTTAGRALGVGGFGLMPGNAKHFAYTRQETTVLLHGIGPVEFKCVDPADDPRNAKPSSR